MSRPYLILLIYQKQHLSILSLPNFIYTLGKESARYAVKETQRLSLFTIPDKILETVLCNNSHTERRYLTSSIYFSVVKGKYQPLVLVMRFELIL